jgi:peptide/nickel transport system permease protein
MGIVKYLARRLFTIAVSLCVIITITYVLMFLAPGNFFDINRFQNAAQNTSLSTKQILILQKNFEKKYGLDQPLYKQIAIYLADAFRFKFGPSFANPTRTIEDMIREKFPVTLTLTFFSVCLAVFVGIPLGIVAALKRNTVVDYTAMTISMIGQVIPPFVIAVVLVYIFSITFNLLPTSGWEGSRYMVLPVIALAWMSIPSIARFMRSSLLDTLRQDYIRTAYAKGGTDRAVIFGHALRNSLIPIVTILGPQIAFLLVGAVWIEVLFRIPGMGQLFVNAAMQRDYPLLITSTYMLALMVMGMNFIVDIVYAILDPRIKLK